MINMHDEHTAVAAFVWLTQALERALRTLAGSKTLFFRELLSQVPPDILHITHNGWFHGNILHALVLAVMVPGANGMELGRHQQEEAAQVIASIVRGRDAHARSALLEEKDCYGFTPLALCKYYHSGKGRIHSCRHLADTTVEALTAAMMQQTYGTTS